MGCTKPRRRHSPSNPRVEISVKEAKVQENAMAIVDGIEAWKILTGGEERPWPRSSRKELHEPRTRSVAEDTSKTDGLPEGHPAIGQNTSGNVKCPFATMSPTDERDSTKVESSMTQRPESLPTPPHTQEHFADVPYEEPYNRHNSPPPSISGSISKCPIRMLDERSPEEIAQFFENHKHDIPRSHEICVRRYQSDSQTIRQLDAKYGNLTNMIKGLGVKHQPLLPSKENDEELNTAAGTRSMQKVENWAHNVGADGGGAHMPNDTKTHLSESDDMEGDHFDRPLKEVRLGESPSRPWGIRVPAAIPHLSLNENASTPTPTPKGTQSKPQDVLVGDRESVAAVYAGDESRGEKHGMLFTGPVFIGYAPEQAAALIRDCRLQA
ncbi:hypothetical protein BDR22DRAFT_593601 [Usnea florida]